MEAQTVHIPDNEQYRELKRFIDANREVPGPLIQVLHRAQKIFGYLPLEVQHFVARELNVSLSKVFGVVTFYNFFRMDPIGDHNINMCLGTACHVKGAPRLVTTLEEELGIKAGETSTDYRVTLEVVYCLGSCALAPMAVIDGQVVGRLVPEKVLKLVRDLD